MKEGLHVVKGVGDMLHVHVSPDGEESKYAELEKMLKLFETGSKLKIGGRTVVRVISSEIMEFPKHKVVNGNSPVQATNTYLVLE